MKYLFALFAVAIMSLTNCKKDDTASIVGNWSLINDSVYSNVGIYSTAHNYKGLNSDYFYFSDDGWLYVKEDSLFDTLNYRLLSNNRIIIDSISIVENGEYMPSNITTLTAHKASLAMVPGVQNPGGIYARYINLRR